MSDTPQLDRSDKVGLYGSIVAMGVGAVIAVISAVARLTEVAPGTDVPVTVPLAGETAQLPLGPDGSLIPATVETATVIVAEPAPATLFALWAQPIWSSLIVIVGLALAALFFRRLASGAIFDRGAANLAFIAGGVVAVGWVGSTILTNMTTNGALSAISDYDYDSVTFSVSLVPALGVLLLGALGTGLQLGEKLRRETEGLA